MTSGLELSVLSTCGLPWPRLDSFSGTGADSIPSSDSEGTSKLLANQHKLVQVSCKTIFFQHDGTIWIHLELTKSNQGVLSGQDAV